MNIDVVCKTVVNKYNEEKINILSKWCEENEITYVTSANLMDSYDGKDNGQYLSSKSFRDIKELAAEEKLLSEYSTYTIHEKARKKEYFDCKAGSTDFMWTYDDYLTFCMRASTLEQFKFLINGRTIELAYNEMLNKMDALRGQVLKNCIGCKYTELCSKCFIDDFLETDELSHQEFCLNHIKAHNKIGKLFENET